MRRTEIDGLRAVAVVSVIINHVDKTFLPNGHLGVDIFYVISGFVITQSLITRQHSCFSDYILGFYNRRVKRLMPALFLCIAVTSIFILLVISPDSSFSTSSIYRTGVAALFGVSNITLLRHATDYFGPSAELNPFTHTWSLGVEEQFYLFFPFILWFSGLPQKRRKGFRNFSLIISATAIASLISYVWLSNLSPTVAFYLMPTRFWELAIGAIACLALMRQQNIKATYAKFAQHITFFALMTLILVLFLPQLQSYKGLTTFAVVILTGVLIFGIRPASLAYRLLTLKPLVFIGVISYSLYLWHWSVLTIGRRTIGLEFWSIPFQLAAIVLFSVLSYQYVEKPLRQSDWDVLKAGRYRIGEIGHSVAFALGLGLVIVVIAIPLHKKGYLYTGTSAPLIKKGAKTLEDRQINKDYAWVAKLCVGLSKNDVGKVISLEDCTFGEFTSAKQRFLVIGNSFSVAEIEMFKILVTEKRGSVTVTSSPGASPVPEIENKGTWGKANDYYWTSVIPTLLDKLQAGDVLLMVNDGADFSPKKHTVASKQRISDLQKGLERISKEMSKRGILVIYQDGIPFMRESSCTPDTATPQWWHFLNEPPCAYYTRKESLKRRSMYHDSLLELQHKFINFAVLDLFDVFCPSEVCKFYNDEGIFLYRDEWSHPSVEASILAQPLLLETLDKLSRAKPYPANPR